MDFKRIELLFGTEEKLLVGVNMKIEELTIRDVKTICKSKRYCPKTCPLAKHQWCCLGLRNMTEKELKQEIEYAHK